jgi:AAA+ ATPase superfamily predicted ATPase
MYSLDVRAPEKSRNSRYFLHDSFLAFHFRFVLPNVSALQSGHAEAVWNLKIAPYLDDYMGERFEEICREWLKLYGQERLGVPAQTAGKIWSRDYDVDVAGTLLDDRRAAGECKWWKKPVGGNVLSELQQDAAKSPYFAGSDPVWVLFGRGGFTADLRQAAKGDPRVELLTPRDLLARG